MESFLEFERDQVQEAGKKTQVWRVKSKRTGNILGYIRWYAQWRQYAFFPHVLTIFNPTCLDEISKKAHNLTGAHRRLKGGTTSGA